MIAPLVKTKPEDTRARIMETAEALFRRLGYAKTAVADIASELRMSPANVYRFFPSKTAIVQAICQRCLNELDEKVWAVARSKASASERLERLQLEILAYHKENLLEEQKVNDIVMVAMEESWDAIMAHKERHPHGHRADPARRYRGRRVRAGRSARNLRACHARPRSAYCHPLLIAQGLQEGHDLEAEARSLDPLPAARHHPPKVVPS